MQFGRSLSRYDSVTALILSAWLLRLLGALPYTWVVSGEGNHGTGSDRISGQQTECEGGCRGGSATPPQTTARRRFPHSFSRKKWLVFYTHLIHLFTIIATIMLSFFVANRKVKIYPRSATFQVAKLAINLMKTILAVFMLFYMNLKRDILARVLENFNKTFSHVSHQRLSIGCTERFISVYLIIIIFPDIVLAMLNSVNYTHAFCLVASILFMDIMQNATVLLFSSVAAIAAAGYDQIIPCRIKQLLGEHSHEAFLDGSDGLSQIISTEKSTQRNNRTSMTLEEVKFAIDKVHKLQMFHCSFNRYVTVPLTAVILKSIINATLLLFYVTSLHGEAVTLVCVVSVTLRDVLCLIFIYCIPERVSSQVSLDDI